MTLMRQVPIRPDHRGTPLRGQSRAHERHTSAPPRAVTQHGTGNQARLQALAATARVTKRTAERAGGAPHVQRFSAKEHADIGDLAYRHARFGQDPKALKTSPLGKILLEGTRFRLGKKSFTYGEIVAEADYFEHFSEFFGEEGEYPWYAKLLPGYKEAREGALATRNVPHFTPDNVRLWLTLHDAAVDQMVTAHNQLDLASEILKDFDVRLERIRTALVEGRDEEADALLNDYQRYYARQEKRVSALITSGHARAREALMANAFADHFLTDAFSAGHVVTPRESILREANVRLEEPVSVGAMYRGAILGLTWDELAEVRAQARSVAWHDLDNHFGVEVSVSDPGFGQWIACGDNCSTITGPSHWHATRAAAIVATEKSVAHLWTAALTGSKPRDYRAVLDLVPRPTWRNYPAWGAAEWAQQLGYVRGDNAPAAPQGRQMTPFAIELHPIEHCRAFDESEELPCYRPYIGTSKDWVKRFDFNTWVKPKIGAVKAEAATRYRF